MGCSERKENGREERDIYTWTLVVPSSSTPEFSLASAFSSTPTPMPSLSPSSLPSSTADNACTNVVVMSCSDITTPDDNDAEELDGSFTPEECCRACFNAPGCTYGAQYYDDTVCYIYTETGAEANQCLLGVQAVENTEEMPSWGPGPFGAAVA
ncbi:hypothetical protein EJ02DRAFT_508406 [Clathrospora elynae]|uniref:Uncharacterized protein n=1 Tax=Clathrospora elynae TaxID=706981 RepID=A0A6A5T480_9PLEO|nr:hypothetical protein EJ02DRAFT_508406 [Clathrospora elynae]